MRTHPPDLNITTVIVRGEPTDECDQCGALALITTTWTPSDEKFGQVATCFAPECVRWGINTARDSAQDNTIITVEFARYLRHSPIALEMAA